MTDLRQAVSHRTQWQLQRSSNQEQVARGEPVRLTFWGVRGSAPAPGRHTLRYGGNTPCVELWLGSHLFILDAGTGLRELGHQLHSELRVPESGVPGLEACILLSHYHWDHVQGLPFFEPLYFAGNTFHLFGPRPAGNGRTGLNQILDALFTAPYFPVSTAALKAAYSLGELDGNSQFTLGPARIRTCPLNHPQGALAYRLEAGGVAIVYATDHEPGQAEADQALRTLARGADLLISDAQYRPEELGAQKQGWGHGSWESAAALARDADVKHLMLFHHEPLRSDEELDALLEQARRAFPQTSAAAEGTTVELSGRDIRVLARANGFTLNGLTVNGRDAPFDSAQGKQAAELAGRAAETQTYPAISIPSARSKRRHERIPLQNTESYGVLCNSARATVSRVLDLSEGGVSFLLDEESHVPETLHARLHVPMMAESELNLRRIYTKPLGQGLLRVGCSFGP